MYGKQGYQVELIIKEPKKEHKVVIDHHKKLTPEAAIVILTQKYSKIKVKVDFMTKLDLAYDAMIEYTEKK